MILLYNSIQPMPNVYKTPSMVMSPQSIPTAYANIDASQTEWRRSEPMPPTHNHSLTDWKMVNKIKILIL